MCKHINCLANSFCTITSGRIWTTITCRKSHDKKVMYKHIAQRLLQKMKTPRLSWWLPLPEVPLFSDRACPSLVSGVQRSSAPPNLFSFQTKPFSFQAVPQPVSNWHILHFVWKRRGRGGGGVVLWRHTKDSILGGPCYFEPGRKKWPFDPRK